MAKPKFQQVGPVSFDHFINAFDAAYWNNQKDSRLSDRAIKLIEESKELAEALENLEWAERPTETLINFDNAMQNMLWELSDVLSIVKHIEAKVLTYLYNQPTERTVLGLERCLLGMATLKTTMRQVDPDWGREE